MTEAVKQASVLALLSPKASAKGAKTAGVPAFGDMLRGAGHAKTKKDDGLGMPDGAKTRWEKPQLVDGETALPVELPVDTTEMTVETRKPAPTRETRETHVTRETIARLVMRRDDRPAGDSKVAAIDDAVDAEPETPDVEDKDSVTPVGAGDAIIQFTAALELLRRGDRSEEPPPPVQGKATATPAATVGEASPAATVPSASSAEPAQSGDGADAPTARSAAISAAADVAIEGLTSAKVETQTPAPAPQQAALQTVMAAQIISAEAAPAPAPKQAAVQAVVSAQISTAATAPALATAAVLTQVATAGQPTTVTDAEGDTPGSPIDTKPAALSGDIPAPKSATTAAPTVSQPVNRQTPDQPAADLRQPAADRRQPAPATDAIRNTATASDINGGTDGAAQPSVKAAPEARRIETAQVKTAAPAADMQATSAPTPAPSQNATAIVAAISTDPSLRPGVESLAQTLMRMSSANGGPVQTLKVQLNPVELGVVTAEMRFAGEQLSVELQVDNPEAYQRLMLDKDTIAKSLRALGIDVDQVSVQQPQITTNASVRADIGNGSPGGFAREDSNFQSWSSSGGNDRTGGQASGKERDNGGNRHETSGSAGQNGSGSGLYI